MYDNALTVTPIIFLSSLLRTLKILRSIDNERKEEKIFILFSL